MNDFEIKQLIASTIICSLLVYFFFSFADPYTFISHYFRRYTLQLESKTVLENIKLNSTRNETELLQLEEEITQMENDLKEAKLKQKNAKNNTNSGSFKTPNFMLSPTQSINPETAISSTTNIQVAAVRATEVLEEGDEMIENSSLPPKKNKFQMNVVNSQRTVLLSQGHPVNKWSSIRISWRGTVASMSTS